MSFPITFSKFEAIPLSRDPAKVLIRWDIMPTKADLSDFEFFIDARESPDQIPHFQNVTIDGELFDSYAPTTSSINQPPITKAISALDFYEYNDYLPYLKNLSKHIYYKIRCRRISTQEEISTPPFSWFGELDLIGLYVVEEHNFLLEDAIGTPCLVYIRRRSGLRCCCFDEVQKKRLISNCKRCYGTNWVDGFYNPIDTYVDFNPSQENSIIQEWGEVQPNETNILLSNYPLLSSGDLVRELRENRLWRVVSSKQTEKRRTPMLQFARVTEVKPGDIEHNLPIDQKFVLDKIKQFEDMRLLREF
jgi:hypothetical protein